MKVIFECENGHQWAESVFVDSMDCNKLKAQHKPICPVCNPPQLAYGPITEEMVAEMLFVAANPGKVAEETYAYMSVDYRGHISAQARAVIRLLDCAFGDEGHYLLNDVVPDCGPRATTPAKFWHAKLLELARDE